ncbi:hypothetical protein TNCV_139981 [Trichonephila clavipes]|uniref:Uncharacterized protein n=1 Tax=Trichonephila clavipes TaxID=2585209 RepID=A0A8X6RIT5_TRICX|nr:hypothetical protein TNCV_139981 [Trichonephila clavipes]
MYSSCEEREVLSFSFRNVGGSPLCGIVNWHCSVESDGMVVTWFRKAMGTRQWGRLVSTDAAYIDYAGKGENIAPVDEESALMDKDDGPEVPISLEVTIS